MLRILQMNASKIKSEGNNNMWSKDEEDVISDSIVEEDISENNI